MRKKDIRIRRKEKKERKRKRNKPVNLLRSESGGNNLSSE
jgi:hypothetical protein